MNLKELFIIINEQMLLGYTLKDCIEILNSYNSTDYLNYVKKNEMKYNREVVISNKNIEMVIITWSKGQTSGYHGHPGDCIFKILENTMTEEQINVNNQISERVYKQGDSGYISNSIGIHNVSVVSDAVSLHIYSPPF